MTTTFARFVPRLQDAIVSRLGWTALRPVQEEAGAAILDGRNAVVLAPTAGGKTEAALFPILSALCEAQTEGVAALYVAPIKALLNNQADRLGTYAEMVGLERFVWHGDTPDAAKRRFVEEPTELLLTTPESLEVMLLSPRVPVARLFRELRFVVVDEIHALAGEDRGAHLLSVVERLARYTTNDVQRIGLSATVGNPAAILRWLQGSSGREGVVVDPPRASARREVLVLCRPELRDLARDAGRLAAGQKSLFFCQSRATAESAAQRMIDSGTDVFVHHSSVSAEERARAEERFHTGRNACIVCTSTLELGIDVGDLDRVFQAGCPTTVSSFLQRMGRTGRRTGQVANTTFLCETPEEVLQAAALVELAREGWVESVATSDRCWPVLVHQLMALTLQFGAITAEACWEQLARVPDFRGIARAEFDALIEHLVATGYLFRADGSLSLGETAEKAFGRKNFMELYAVFSSPQLYHVLTASGHELGSLEQGFVDTLVEEMTSFLLGGRAWTVEAIFHKERVVRVRPAPRGKEPSWGGFAPQLLSGDLCQKMRRLLVEEGELPYLHETAAEALMGLRESLGPLLRRAGRALQVDEEGAHWWTFAGGRVNHTLRHGLELQYGWRIAVDNVQVRIRGEGVTAERLEAGIARLRDEAYWTSGTTWRDIVARLPNYRLSKFQRALPDAQARELVAAYLLDVPGMRGALGCERIGTLDRTR